jgi:NAD(P)-dependent dehydrogenase (short-subunit alcohol dehydrogenase family)
MSGTLSGQHALVTGGGTGIGASIAQRLARAGARVTLVGRREAPLVDTLATLGGAADVVGHAQADASDEGAVRAAFESAQSARGVVTILVNNAGGAPSAPVQKTTSQLFAQVLAMNLTSTHVCSREFLARLPKATAGRIVNVASIAGLKGFPYVTAYCAAKHGVVGYTRALALELARRPVTVNAVCPGYTETALLDGAIDTIVRTTGRSPEEARAELARANPQGRLVRVEEVAECVHWLCLPEASSVTGTAVPIAGGEA